MYKLFYIIMLFLSVPAVSFGNGKATADTARGLDYGEAAWQNGMLNIECLHNRGFTGKGITIAHFDNGFNGIDTLEAFRHIFEQERLKGTYDYVNGRDSVFRRVGNHGTHTFSMIGAHMPGVMVGTAFDANVILAITENSRSETHREEHNWANAMEWADSLGADIITSSLGYAEFDSLEGNYTYADMNGDNSIVTVAADEAASRGILVVVPAGNSGHKPWRFINAPGDADSALTVGAVDSIGRHVMFSSYGPTADGRIKPDVAAMGYNVNYVHSNGRMISGNGTSFSTPMVAGLAACLMQAHPGRSNMEIISAIRQSAHSYHSPDNSTGYGIPDACRADSILSVMDELAGSDAVMSGNPVEQYYEISEKEGQLSLRRRKGVKRADRIMTITITDLTEKVWLKMQKPVIKRNNDLAFPGMKGFPGGFYLIKLILKNGESYTVMTTVNNR